MPGQGSFLFVTWSGGGNVFPLRAIARHLRDRGHRVTILGSADLRPAFESSAFEFRTYRSRAESAAGLDGQAALDASLRARADDFLAAARDTDAQVILIDYMMPELLSAAETLDIPAAALVHTLYQRQAVASHTPMNMSGGADAINRLRASLSLPPTPSLPALLDACVRVLVVTSQDLDQPHLPLPANVRFTGPLVDAAGPAAWDPAFADRSRPLVHVSMGTVAGDSDALPRIQLALDAMADMPVNVFVTLPRPEDQPWAQTPPAGPEALRLPSNAAAARFVPHAAVLPHTALFVTHAGMGSIGAALTYGVPMVCMPIFLEQPTNAEQVGALGAGRNAGQQPSLEALRAAIEDVLSNPRYTEVARSVASKLRAEGNGLQAVTELESFL